MFDDGNILTDQQALQERDTLVADTVAHYADKVLRTLAEEHSRETGMAAQPRSFLTLDPQVVDKLPGVFAVCTYMEGDDIKEEMLYDGTVANLLGENDLLVTDVLAFEPAMEPAAPAAV